MFKKVFALGLVAAASAAGAPAATNMRLRGGGAFGDLTKAPSKFLVLQPLPLPPIPWLRPHPLLNAPDACPRAWCKKFALEDVVRL